MATFASGGFHGTKYCKENEFGITPRNPVMRGLRHTSNSMVLSKETIESEELRSDAQISDMRHGNRQSSGDIGIELSFGEYDDILAAAVRSEWQNNPDIPGQQFLVAGTKMTSFTIERVFNDIKQYQVFTGVEVDTFSFTIQPNAMVTGTVTFIGSDVYFSDAPLDPAPLPSYTYPPYDGFRGKLVEGGVVNSVVTSLEINIENSLEANFVIGSDKAEAITAGRINVNGTISAYFQNRSMLQKFIDEEETSLEFTLGDGIAQSYVITLPRIKYTGGDNPVDGEGPITLNMPFQALFDECTGTNIRIDKIPPAATAICVAEYDNTEFTESASVPGTIPTAITVSLSGGSKQKNFNGAVGGPIPGVVWTGVPTGMMGSAIKVDGATAKLSLTGTAEAALTASTVQVAFAESSFTFGYCNCPNDAVVDSTISFDIVPA